ncbi:carbamoyltransferase HypF [Roseibium denhamense]|uniref:Carbamoyltransferase HypF n=2 Tax=Roseibium denhamense TaxID=76305 RepID=A0ABY1NJZ2_9HYPH|nr:carbamoyltransferase HypF [Roseibium denhamense]SMP09603.1 hydrogenase maturation protein HypF [Roseibium denhamense]
MPGIGHSIRVSGLVQGVGLRPFVWRLASRLGLKGSVLNDGSDVLIEVFGSEANLKQFSSLLLEDLPPLARIDAVSVSAKTCNPPAGFTIAASVDGSAPTGVVPDAATCPQCLKEIFDPANRRFGYPFTNCTHCGPRLSILRQIPYDRPSTSMAVFDMCRRCRTEYEDPDDRRFHAQPNACPDCGPRLWFEDLKGNRDGQDVFAKVARRLKQGDIVAIKGLGGFQIACDAGNSEAIKRLRLRKNRPRKPFALMARDIAQVRQYCRVSESEEYMLAGPEAPIVLLEKEGASLPNEIAFEQPRLGMMLPNTPLHHLLMTQLDVPIVLTSGNLSNNPQEISNHGATQRLGALVDGFLMHDREIVNRVDDSVLQWEKRGPVVIRRARGLAPSPIRLPDSFANAPKVLAMGGELKAAFCLLNGRNAVLSQHIGDLENAATFKDYRKALRLYLELYQFKPDIIAVDQHPQYRSTEFGRELADELGAELVKVQHHHAHLCAVLAECQAATEQCRPAYGIILDGLGWGLDGTVWGGEILQGDFASFQRLGHLQAVPMPGGASASVEPWRNLQAHLRNCFGVSWREVLADPVSVDLFSSRRSALLDTMMEKGVNAPVSTSAGRLFDAVAAALDLCVDRQSFEGEAAMLLEAAAAPYVPDEAGYKVFLEQKALLEIGMKPLWEQLLQDKRNLVADGRIAARFHLGLIDALESGLAAVSGSTPGHVVLSGGVFQNRILREGLRDRLEQAGWTLLFSKQAPCNDGGLALGQAVAAAVTRAH